MKSFLLFYSFFLLFNFSNNHVQGQTTDTGNNKDGTNSLYLNKATGHLKIVGAVTPDTFQVYFSLPIPYREQSPIWLDIDCPEMISYRFVHLDSVNIFVSALLKNSPDTIYLNWTSYVAIKTNRYYDLPDFIPLPDTAAYTQEIKKYLMPTACCQYKEPFIQDIAAELMDTNTNLRRLAKKITYYCRDHINYGFPVEPISFDAYYALKWGGSCISKAHGAAALLRANHIAVRNLEVIPISSNFDMHWIIEYYAPGYGWVKVETTLGNEPYFSQHMAMVTFACNPEDEFPMFYPDNIESYWFASDSNHFAPIWGRSHSGYYFKVLYDSINKINTTVALTDSVYHYFSYFQGIKLNQKQEETILAAKQFQYKAFEQLTAENLDSALYYLNLSLEKYRNTLRFPFQIIFYDDFENGNKGWSHAGINDDWQMGIPSSPGPPKAYSGSQCWGMNLDGFYQNNTDCYLQSPVISLQNLSCAFLSVKIWNDVEDSLQRRPPKDPLTLEISIDNGVTFSSITRGFGGGIDYNTGVSRVPGWSRLTLDLSRYIDKDVIIRFHFTSNGTKTRPGSYIDNFKVYGRYFSPDNIAENKKNDKGFRLYPNPANDFITIELERALSIPSSCTIFNINGQKVLETKLKNRKTVLKTNHLPKGVYIVKVGKDKNGSVKRFVKERNR